MTPVPTKYPIPEETVVTQKAAGIVQEVADILITTVENIVVTCLQNSEYVDQFAIRAYPHPPRGQLGTDWIQFRGRFRRAVRKLMDGEQARRAALQSEGEPK